MSLLRFILIVICSFSLLQLYAQTDTVEVSSDKNRFYIFKTYEDYLNNNTSNEVSGTIKYSKASRKNSNIVSSKPVFNSSVGKIWGFSDGENVFVKFQVELFGPVFWRLQCKGKNPYFFYKQKMIMAAGPGLIPLMTVATTAAIPAQYSVAVVMPSGKRKEVTRKRLKKVFAQSPPMLDSLRKVKMMSRPTSVSLLKQFNEAE